MLVYIIDLGRRSNLIASKCTFSVELLMQKHLYNLRYKVDKTEWRARAKRSLIFDFLEKYCNKFSKISTVLDYGCGTGVLQIELEKKFKNVVTYGVDVSKQAVDYCKQRGTKNVVVFDGMEIPFPNGKFDLITAVDVLEHVKDDIVVLKEFKRVLKPNGIAIILVPAHNNLWSTRDIRLKHFRRYEPRELEEKINKVKFKILETKNVDFALYFLLLLLCKFSKKKNGVADLSIETVKTNYILNEIFFLYEIIENKFQKLSTFPVGISKVIVVMHTR